MGRKGIGKLSVFSIADTVEVHSARDGERNALRIEVEDLKKRIEEDKPHNPEQIPVASGVGEHGTLIRLTDLRRRRIDVALNALRKRVAAVRHPDTGRSQARRRRDAGRRNTE